jgi:type IV fimbrial biogenesis protein FimT
MRGLTLVELLVVIAIAAVLAVIAVPSLRSTLQTNQLDTVSNQLVAALATARSEAVRAPDLTVQVANPSAATPKQWSNGWATTAQPLAGPQLNLQAPLPVPGQLSVNSNWPGPIGFDAMGRLVLANPPPLIFVICLDPAQPTVNQSRAVIVSASGRASIAHIGKAGANQGIPVDDTNAPILTCSP